LQTSKPPRAVRESTRRCTACSGPASGQPSWTLCPYCYCTNQVGNLTLKHARGVARRAEIQLDVNRLSAECDSALKTLQPLERSLADLPWFTRKFAAGELKKAIADQKAAWWEIRARINRLYGENQGINAGYLGQQLRVASKRLAGQKPYSRSAEAAELADQEHRRQLARQQLDASFERTRLTIRECDYRRGNALDNYARNRLRHIILDVSNNCCASCHGTANLTLDHFGLPKNSGGNFILYSPETGTLQLNVVPLCRSCNSRKGERASIDMFTAEQLDAIRDAHATMLETLLGWAPAIRVIIRCYGLRQHTFGKKPTHNLPSPTPIDIER
jgi:5-methylcytosine-specific restriction endonuclease McrA